MSVFFIYRTGKKKQKVGLSSPSFPTNAITGKSYIETRVLSNMTEGSDLVEIPCIIRYKIYAEGYAWSVSLKYILSCGSMTLIISPEYEDFFSRGLLPKENYWPVSPTDLCRSIKHAVDWGNANPSDVYTPHFLIELSIYQISFMFLRRFPFNRLKE